MFTDLPEVTVNSIATYLPSLSRALIVVATRQYQILLDGINWENLDFYELGKELATKLCDEDVREILVCIDAKRTVKKINLAYLGYFWEWTATSLGIYSA